MIFNNYRGFNAADADVQSWCQQRFPDDPAMQAKCSVNSFPMSVSPPWTDLGSILRGIPKPSSLLVTTAEGGAGGSGYGPPRPPAASTSSGIFGIPTTIMVAGGAVLAIGVGAMVLAKRRKRPAVAGYRRRRKSRR